MKSLQKTIESLLKKNPKQNLSIKEIGFLLENPKISSKKIQKALIQLAKKGVIQETKSEQFKPNQKNKKPAQFVQGKLDWAKKGFGFLICNQKEDLFIAKNNMAGALDGDTVNVRLKRDRRGRLEGVVCDIIERGRVWVGRLEKQKKHILVINEDYNDPVIFEVEEVGEAKPGDLVVVSPTLKKPRYFGASHHAKLVKKLGAFDDKQTQREKILIEKGFVREWDEATYASAKKVLQKTKDLTPRKNLNHLPFVTIDGPTAKDFDDAVYVSKTKQGFKLLVAIADVAHFVQPKSVLDEEALKRSFSLYFPGGVIPMLPEILSNDACSLNPDQTKKVMVCQIEFDLKANPKKALVFAASIKSKKRLTYEEVDLFFKGKKNWDSKKMCQSLLNQKDLAKLLLQKRQKRGALDFDLTEAVFEFDKKNNVKKIGKRKTLFSHQLIEEFMISANIATCLILEKYKQPVVYRTHEAPEASKVDELTRRLAYLGAKNIDDFHHPVGLAKVIHKTLKKENHFALHYALLRSMMKAAYSTKPLGHFGLALNHYCHFTSPIRRYADLLIHRQLKTCLRQNKEDQLSVSLNNQDWQYGVFRAKSKSEKSKKKSAKQKSFQKIKSQSPLSPTAKIISEKEAKINEAERSLIRLESCFFMEKFLAKKQKPPLFLGMICHFVREGFFVQLDNPFVEGFVDGQKIGNQCYFDEKRFEFVIKKARQKHVFRLGDRVEVQLKQIDWQKHKILLGLENL